MNTDETITTCPGCGLPAHATETNDNGYHPECSVLASTDPRQDSARRLAELSAKYAKEVARLRRSLALQSIWPGVFAHGTATTTWTARNRLSRPSEVRANGRYTPEIKTLKITNGAGEERVFPAGEVPAEIPRPDSLVSK